MKVELGDHKLEVELEFRFWWEPRRMLRIGFLLASGGGCLA